MTIEILKSVAMLDSAKRDSINAQLQTLAKKVDGGQISIVKAIKLARVVK